MEDQHRRATAEVIRICREQGRDVSQMLAAYTVQAVLLQNTQKQAKLDDTAFDQCVRRSVELLNQVSFMQKRGFKLEEVFHEAD
jgi:hypothetical protein